MEYLRPGKVYYKMGFKAFGVFIAAFLLCQAFLFFFPGWLASIFISVFIMAMVMKDHFPGRMR